MLTKAGMDQAWTSDPGPVLISKSEIAARVKSLADEISRDYQGQRIKVGVVLAGAIVFAADLVRQISLDVEIFFIQASSYGDGTVSSGQVRVRRDEKVDLADAHVLVVDDILDTGYTARALLDNLRSDRPATVRMATLLNKQARRRVDVQADYVGFEVPNKFVVGYGMDHSGSFRHLPSVHALD
ncbi:MAG: hypoxanthine phosphoribosyltransferase [Bryobacterales bacterium]|nr:hypoxanthine phosphoribosyltransferase [Bryobacterales bacterium]MDE0622278.1 hypoxanthine phosphoribosyltransferase [Bryobacterales bacterium]